MGTTFALAYPYNPKRVNVWASPNPNGTFDCLNGAWRGTFDEDQNLIRFGRGGSTEPLAAIKVWEGVVPPEHQNYNAAIAWIEEQIV